MKIIDGKLIAADIYTKLRNDIIESKISPKLGVILASNDPASEMYVNLKIKKAGSLGIKTELHRFENTVSADELIERVRELNFDKETTGILVQLPLSQWIYPDEVTKVLNSIFPNKDVDCLTSSNLGRIFQYPLAEIILPATVDAVLESLTFALGDLSLLASKNIVIINNSNLIGKPLATLLSTYNATVTIANKFTQDLKEVCLNSDIIISATGQTSIIDHTFIKQDAILIDITSQKFGDKVLGDFIYSDELASKAGFITPVPGGIGPLTIASLFKNLIKLTKEQNG